MTKIFKCDIKIFLFFLRAPFFGVSFLLCIVYFLLLSFILHLFTKKTRRGTLVLALPGRLPDAGPGLDPFKGSSGLPRLAGFGNFKGLSYKYRY